MKYAITNRNRFGNNLFEDWDKLFFNPFETSELKTDIREKDGNYILDVDLPGFRKEDIDVSMDDGYLTVRAERKEEKEEKDEKGRYLRRERCYGTCSRSFYVGDIDEKTIKASYSDGILTVTIPQDQPKKLEEKKTHRNRIISSPTKGPRRKPRFFFDCS